MGGLSRLAASHLPGGAVCPASTSNVEIGQTISPLKGHGLGEKGEKGAREKVTKRGEGRTEWNGGTAPGALT